MESLYDADSNKDILMQMLLGRFFEEKVQELFDEGRLHGTAHLAIGEEAAAVGTVKALREDDYVFGSHRGHVQAIAKGLDINALMAELFGKVTGVCRGAGGSMHVADADRYYYSMDGVLGASAVICCGTALKIKMKNEKDRIAAVFFGDGTSNEGATYEAFNLASVWELPVLFCCVNNTYGMSTPLSKATNSTDIAARAALFGMEAASVDGNDVAAVYNAAAHARTYAAENGKPYLLVLNTYRTCGHSKSDKNVYRTKAEIEEWKKACPIARFEGKMLGARYSAEDIEELESRARAIVEEAVAFAERSAYPALADLDDMVYSDRI